MMYPVYLQKSKYLCLKQRKWVKAGGVLIYYGKDEDPYQTVSEWWNTKEIAIKPLQKLIQLLGIHPSGNDQQYTIGKGAVNVVREDPKKLC